MDHLDVDIKVNVKEMGYSVWTESCSGWAGDGFVASVELALGVCQRQEVSAVCIRFPTSSLVHVGASGVCVCVCVCVREEMRSRSPGRQLSGRQSGARSLLGVVAFAPFRTRC
jgi:hypothetical protein